MTPKNIGCHILDINHIISIVNVRAIFRHTSTSDNFRTEICLTSRMSDGLGQIFFSGTGTDGSNLSLAGHQIRWWSEYHKLYLARVQISKICPFHVNTKLIKAKKICSPNSNLRNSMHCTGIASCFK